MTRIARIVAPYLPHHVGQRRMAEQKGKGGRVTVIPYLNHQCERSNITIWSSVKC